jgi:CheY-like chemotaxis protein
MPRLLLIEDDQQLRELLRITLESAGHEVTEAGHGNEGIGLCRTAPFDLVITDLFMPEREGLETIVQLREEFPGLAIIAISGEHFESHSMLRTAKQLGAARVLAKPFPSADLLNAINEVLGLPPRKA